MFGVPVAYTPWFRHPAPGVTRQSGFLTPDLRHAPPSSGCWRSDALLLRHRSELGLHLRADLHPERRHRAGRRVSAPASTTATPSSAAAGTYAVRDESDHDSEQGHGLPRLLPRPRRLRGQRSLATPATTSILSSDNTFLDRYQIDDSQRAAQPRLSRGLRGQRNFWSLNGYYFQGLAPFYDQDTIPVALPLARDPAGQRPVTAGAPISPPNSNVLALTRNEGPGYAARVATASAGPCPMSGRSATSTARRQPARRRLQHRRRSRARSVPTAARRPRRRVLPRFTGRLELAAGRLRPAPGCTRSSRWSASTSRPTWGNTQQDPQRGQLGLRVRRDQPVRAGPLPGPRSDRHRQPGRLRPALQLFRPAGHRVQRHLRPELLASPRISSSRRNPACRTISRTMSARSMCGPAPARPQLPLPPGQERPEVPPQRRAGHVRAELPALQPRLHQPVARAARRSTTTTTVRRQPERVRIARGDHARRARQAHRPDRHRRADPPRPQRQARPSPTRRV